MMSIPELMHRRLVREASLHLGDRQSSRTLRDLCRRFLAQNPLPVKPYK
jgi:hypothetical protein